jgi:hypothetical protein
MAALAVVFVAIAAILCVAALLALLRIGALMLSGAEALERDGLGRGARAPRWTLADTEGTERSSPPSPPSPLSAPLQLLVFADHGLKSFPSVVAGLRDLVGQEDLEIVVVARGSAAAAAAAEALPRFGLAGIPVLSGSPRLYARYNVRVMPFVIFVDSFGLVRGSSLVNHDWQLAMLRKVAAIAPAEDDGQVTAAPPPATPVLAS